MTDDELKAIEARVNAATPGPWYIWDETWVMTHIPGDDIGTNRAAAVCDFGLGGPRNADFIAHARTDIPRLVAELRAAREAWRKLWCEEERDRGKQCKEYLCQVCEARKALGEE